jgi:mandelamide amidase
LLDSILSGEIDSNDKVLLKNLRIGVPREYFYDNLEYQIAEETESLLKQLKEAGVELVYEDLKNISELNEQVGFPVVLFETNQLLTSYIANNLPTETIHSFIDKIASPDVKGIIEMAVNGSITKKVYNDIIDRIKPQLQNLYSTYFSQQNVDAIIFPTTPLSARPIKGSIETVELNGVQVPTFATYIRNTDPSSNAGIPSLSIPLSVTTDGLPFGVEIDGPVGSDQRLLAIGLEIEKLIKFTTNKKNGSNTI